MRHTANRALGAVLMAVCLTCAGETPSYKPRAGDILFQSLPHNPLIDAIEGATDSPYSHCGIVVEGANGWAVLEAIGPVREIPLKRWLGQGRGGTHDAYRLRPQHRKYIDKTIREARKFLGRPYDIQYHFDDEKIYCSELIYKAFKAATEGQELGEVKRLGELNWKPFAATIIAIDGGLPLERRMITPRHLAEAPQLMRVHHGIPAPKKQAKKTPARPTSKTAPRHNPWATRRK